MYFNILILNTFNNSKICNAAQLTLVEIILQQNYPSWYEHNFS